jgi:hypothetical protein
MRYVSALLLLMMWASAAHAADSVAAIEDARPDAPRVRLAESAAAPAPPLVTEVRLAERAELASSTDAAQEMPRRGGMLWVIGALVVAGIILAAVLL